MKPFLLLTPLLLMACAPRAILLREAKATAPRQATERQEVVTAPSTPHEATLSEHSGGNLGLLEPRSITEIPNEREMRPTVDPDDDPAVIGTPPINE